MKETNDSKTVMEECLDLSVQDVSRIVDKIESNPDIKIDSQKILRYLVSMRKVLVSTKNFLGGLKILEDANDSQEQH